MTSLSTIDNLLPQTQCRECGYDACLPYAAAMLNGEASIDQCAPGGLRVLAQLAKQFGVDDSPYQAAVSAHYRPSATAAIREAECIGCTKCIQACPVDAIIGSSKQMHSILEQECTGCGLCVDPCPVDCIDLITLDHARYQPEKARARYQARQRRQEEAKQHKQRHQQSHLQAKTRTHRQDYIKAALARTQTKRPT